MKWWVKRDDLSGFELGGNKVRKLEFLMAEAADAGADCVVTIGGMPVDLGFPGGLDLKSIQNKGLLDLSS